MYYEKKQREHRRPRTTRGETILLFALMAVCISLQFFVRSADPPVAAVFFLILIFEVFQSVTPRLAARPCRRASELTPSPTVSVHLAVRWPLRFPSVAGSHASHLCVTFILDQWISAPRSSLHSDSGYSGLPFPLSLPLSGAEENVEPILLAAHPPMRN